MVPYASSKYVRNPLLTDPLEPALMLVTLRRIAGSVVILLSVVPLFRLIRVDRSGPWGASTIAEAGRSYDVVLWGSVLVVGLALVAGIWARQRERAQPDAPSLLDRLRPLGTALTRVPAAVFSLGCGLSSFGLAVLVAHRVFGRLLTNVDEMTSVIHARYLAAGMLGGPVGETAEAWLIPNMLVTDVGWVSQYPPGHLVLLAFAERLGIPWLLGPALLGLTVAFSSAAAFRLLESRDVEVRIAALLLVLSPFMLLLGGGALSHLSAGAAIAAALYFGVRAAKGRAIWALAAGAATGLAVVSRPWTGLILATALTLGLWLGQMVLARRDEERVRGDRQLIARVSFWVLGGLPLALFIAAYNLQVFGNPLELGYEVLYGPAHQLGFHLDPWGYPYGVREALAYTSADLIRFGVALLDTPVPITLVAGLTLVLAPRLPKGSGILIVWALLPLAANALYWFHQPRMMFEAAPAWVLLGVIGIGLALRSGNAGLRAATGAAVVVSLVVGAWAFVPVRFAGNSWSPETLARISVPQTPESIEPALIFVHASWHERVAGRFQAAGMRNDTLQALIRRNDICALDRYARTRRGQQPRGLGGALDASVDKTQTSELRAGLTPVVTPGGVRVPKLADMTWTPECEREINADRFGAVSLAPLLWQGALPGLDDDGSDPAGRPLFARDFGPEGNAAVVRRFSRRTAWVFTPVSPDSPPRLLPYEEGMALLWGSSPTRAP